jgi:6-phosphogluconolactonase
MKHILTILFLALAMTSPALARDQLVYIGTYTPKTGESRGLYSVRFNPQTGELGDVQVVAELANPTFMELHPRQPILYAISEGRNGEKSEGTVHSFAVEAGKLRTLNVGSTGGDGLCHVGIDTEGRVLVVVSYGGGQITSFPLRQDGTVGARATVIRTAGRLGPNTKRQDKPHPHSATFSPDNRFVYICDLGLDLVFCYAINPATASLRPAGEFATEPGAGPRHSKFSADGRFLYVINELGNTVTLFAANAQTGALQRVESVATLTPPAAESITAEVRLHPSGRFVYGSNRGHDSIALFRRDAATGKLTFVETVSSGGRHPRNFALSPDGRWLLCANRDSDNVVSFRVDDATGKLTATGHSIRVPKAVCVLFAR